MNDVNSHPDSAGVRKQMKLKLEETRKKYKGSKELDDPFLQKRN